MGDGIKGGVYQDATGDGFHDANGNAVTKDGKAIEKAAEPEPKGKKGK